MEMMLTEKEVIGYIKIEFDEEAYNDENSKNQARKKENKCKSLTVQCLSDEQIELVQDKNTAYNMWKCLEERYEKKGITEQLMLKRKLMTAKLREGENLEKFFTEFDEIIRQLKATGAECKEEDLVCNLLLAMPKSFETIIAVLESMPMKELTLNMV